MEIYIAILYLLASLTFLINTLWDIDVPKTWANIIIMLVLSLVWPIPVLFYLVSGRK